MNAIILLSVLTVLILFAGFSKNKFLAYVLTIAGLLGAGTFLYFTWINGNSAYHINMILFDGSAIAFGSLLLLNAGLIIVLMRDSEEQIDIPHAEFYALVIAMTVGGLCMVSYSNMSTLFIGLEILSIAAYILAGSRKRDFKSNEAALKYYLMGAFATGVVLFGIALVYGATGSFDLATIAKVVNSNTQQHSILYVGIIFLLVGFAFKIAAAPFHFWSPDVYTGAPTIVTALMSTLIKTAAIVAFARLFNTCFGSFYGVYGKILLAISAVAMFIGNVSAISQNNIKRMLAYSSIAHSGYLLFALFAITSFSLQSIFVYMTGYLFASVLAFAIIIQVQQAEDSNDLNSFNGLAKRNPYLAFALTIAMLSLAGIPPLAGFIGKFVIFNNAIKNGHIGITIWAVLMSCVGVYYYLKVVMNMFLKRPNSETPIIVTTGYQFVIGLCIVALIVLGLMPGLLTKVF